MGPSQPGGTTSRPAPVVVVERRVQLKPKGQIWIGQPGPAVHDNISVAGLNGVNACAPTRHSAARDPA